MMADVLFLVVPKKELERVLALQSHESLLSVRDDIQTISLSSQVGASLFLAAWRTMVQEEDLVDNYKVSEGAPEVA